MKIQCKRIRYKIIRIPSMGIISNYLHTKYEADIAIKKHKNSILYPIILE